ncbi:MAG: ABC transporter substrate-binding protein [Lachnospiraceae bacterium]|nr:ABC transporter substrate-binding protein [Lachnospiraceae bacterium]
MKNKKMRTVSSLVLAVLLGAVSTFVWGCSSKNTAATNPEPSEAASTASEVAGTLADGSYQLPVKLEGGSGRATIESPTTVTVDDGKISAVITWSSPNYDYMIVDGTRYTPEDYDGSDEHSRFTIPITALDMPIDVTADTTAMSKPYEIAYKITVFSSSGEASSTTSSAENIENADAVKEDWQTYVPDGYTVRKTEENAFATHFQLQKLTDGEGKDRYTLLSLSDGSHFLITSGNDLYRKAKKQVETPASDSSSCTILEAPLTNGYLAATAAMAHFVSLDAMDSLTYVGATTSEWTIDEARDGLADGSLRYAGKYSAPQYEQLLKNETHLAIESTMILHTPAVKEKLEELGIPVMMDLSSYEDDPMGRAEWIKVYGALTGKDEMAKHMFSEEEQKVSSIKGNGAGKTVAFFYIDSQGRAVVRKSADYIPKMIEMAGGEYIFKDLQNKNPNSKSGSVTLTMEEFYATAKDADVLIYNAAIETPVTSIAQLTRKSLALADFKAVKSGDVWVAQSSMYQASDAVADIITGLHDILTGGATDSPFFTKVS